MYLFVSLSIGLFIYLFIVFKRTRKYKYAISHDYVYDLKAPLEHALTINAHHTINLPEKWREYDTLLVKISLDFHPLSFFFKPYIQTGEVKHFFEYGAKGVRYLNLSHVHGSTVTLQCNHVKVSPQEAILYGYKNDIDLSKNILILAPHADDAELAAFGLYKASEHPFIVTTTIGEHGLCNYCDLYRDKTKASVKKGELRAHDALCIPLLGGVDIKNSLALGYYGGRLKWMHEHPNETAVSLIDSFGDMNRFRKVSHSDIKLVTHVEARYDSFLTDLEQLLVQIKPEYILTPHPTIDSHPDHQYTTFALAEILKKTGYTCKLLTYTNHLKLSETYPIGSIHSSISLPPNTQEFYFDSVFSFALENEQQIDKFFAIEAMHDLRDSLISISVKKTFSQLTKMVKRAVSGKNKSYFNRAVRANELFFIVESKEIEKLL